VRLFPGFFFPAVCRKKMRTQANDLQYGYERENKNHERIERHLGVSLQKLDKFNVMDWKEVQEDGDESPAWAVEQKARKCSYKWLCDTYSYNGKKTVMIGKNKLEHMKNVNSGVGIVYFDFTDVLMYWVFDDDEYKTFDVEKKFVRGGRVDYVDKPHDVVHIPTDYLKEVPL